MSPIGKAMLSTVLVVIAIAIYVAVLNTQTGTGGALAGTSYTLAVTVLRIVPAIAGLGAIVLIWRSAMSGH